ncbi:MAG: HD domain-containing protein [bacterium]
MFKKLIKDKVFRDSIYGNIKVEHELILELIDSEEVQRLRRIRQLSGVSLVFHTAEHSRFPHALGTYELARRVLVNNTSIRNALSEYEQMVLLTSALLHDIGHGPFSHAFENIFDIPHETMTIKLINSEITDVNKILKKHNSKLIKDISDVLSYKHKNHIISSLISSQIDVDRMDYLSRDSYATGAKYGSIDFERLINIMEVKDNKLVFKARGSYTLESYLMSRYHMYWQVYYHPTSRAYEIILESIYRRILDLEKQGYKLEADIEILSKTLNDHDIASYVEIDDVYINGVIKYLTKSKDKILSDLCKRFLNRKLFKYILVEDHEKEIKKINNKYLKDETLKRYYYKEDTVKQSAYITVVKSDINEIKILLENGEITTLSNYSNVVKGLIESSQKTETTIFYGTDNEI